MRSWLEINLNNLSYNLAQIEKLTNKKVIPVIKANAYGLGSIQIAQYLKSKDYDLYAVANFREALEIKESGVNIKTLIMGNNDKDDLQQAIKNNFSITISSWDDIKNLETIASNINSLIHVKIDTGMGRIGFLPSEAEKAIQYIKTNNLGEIEGIYSHLSSADENEDEFTLNQITQFSKYENNENIKFRHILNSPGIFKYYKNTNTNYVRPGIAMYGILLFDSPLKNILKPVFKLKTKIIYLKKLQKETFISYGKTESGQKGDIIATLPIGYADGLDRRFSNGGIVKVLGQECKIIGRVCMDMTMIVIPESIKDRVEIGTEVDIYDEEIQTAAEKIGTIADELMTRINKRVQRRHI